jgi:hypothetical protein
VTGNRLTTDQNFCIRQMPEKKLEYNEIAYQLFFKLQEKF